MNIKTTSTFSNCKPLQGIFLAEWRWWLIGAVFSFFLASILMSGWPTGLLPNIHYPYAYQGDTFSHTWLIQRAVEGWIFDNPRSGYPFGSNFLDYPGSDSGSLLLLKLLGWISGSAFISFNLFFLLGFSATFITSFCVLRSIGLSKIFAACAALLFAFLPFPFFRLAHLFYTWYFLTPLFYYLGFKIFFNDKDRFFHPLSFLKVSGLVAGCIILASFGVYYALFGTIILSIAAIAAWARSGKIRRISPAIVFISLIIFGIFVNVAPNLIYQKNHGNNVEVAIRSPVDGENYAFKLVQLLLPQQSHRNLKLRKLTQIYSSSYPLINENATSSLGLIGAIGFVLVGLVTLLKLAGRKPIDERLTFLACIVLVLFLFGTIGGLGAIFSMAISSLIRGWNRINVFIAFGTLSMFFLVLQMYLQRFCSTRHITFISTIIAAFLGLLGLYDQTPPANAAHNQHIKKIFERDRDFVHQIENSLPVASAIYQLPYMPFPEIPPMHQLDAYDLMAGVLHSKSLRWNYAGMKGREGDSFYRALAQEPIEKQLAVIKRLGFAGLYIDKRGFEDHGKSLIDTLTQLLGTGPTLIRSDNEAVFFKLPHTAVDLTGLTNTDIMQKAEYDTRGTRYSATLAEGIDFTRDDWPTFIRHVSGISTQKNWKHWSDANIAPQVRLDFYTPLPTKFELILVAEPFGPNANQHLTIKVGAKAYQVLMPPGISEMRIPVDTGNVPTDFIEFIPPYPMSPRMANMGPGRQKLGIRFIHLRIEP
ncbi:MAG: sugar translocase [Gammaproteobacteria bacterium]|jgi:phosphoglycerol transferase|nr:sugar translocase [Gammaproteobacteria bacterium]